MLGEHLSVAVANVNTFFQWLANLNYKYESSLKHDASNFLNDSYPMEFSYNFFSANKLPKSNTFSHELDLNTCDTSCDMYFRPKDKHFLGHKFPLGHLYFNLIQHLNRHKMDQSRVKPKLQKSCICNLCKFRI